MTPISIAIVGCGPAGLAAALYLARAGHDVALIERFEAPKPLGSGLMLQPTGLAVLADLGLDSAILRRGARISRMEGRSAPTGRMALDVRYGALGAKTFGLAVHRASLFGVLHEAVRAAGIAVRSGVEISDLQPVGRASSWLVTRTGDRLGPFDLVVDASGSRSPLPERVFGRGFARPLAYGALWSSLPWPENGAFADDVLTQRYERASVMIGVLPIGRRAPAEPREAAFFWSLKPADYEEWRNAGLDAWKQRVRAIWPETAVLLDAIRDPDQLVLARYGQHTLPKPVGPAVGPPITFIGDCAHSASPQLGQGANMALIDAMALSLALETSDTVNAALEAYPRLRSRHVLVYQTMSRIFTPFFQSDSRLLPTLRDRLVSPMSRIPLVRRTLAALVAGTIVSPLSGPLAARRRLVQSSAADT